MKKLYELLNLLTYNNKGKVFNHFHFIILNNIIHNLQNTYILHKLLSVKASGPLNKIFS